MSGNLSIAEKGSVGRRVAANAGLMVGAKAFAALLGLVSLVIITRSLPIADVGIILFLHAYMLFFAEVTTFQSWQAVIRFGTDDVEKKDTPSLLRLLRFCIALDFVGALAAFFLAVMGLLFFNWLLPLLPNLQDESHLLDINKIIKFGLPYCTLILIHQEGASTGLFRLFDSFKPLAIKELVQPIVRLIGVGLTLYFGWGLIGFIISWYAGSFCRFLALPLMALRELKARNLLRGLFSAWPRLRLARDGVWRFVWKANIDSSLAAGTLHLPVLLVMPIFGAAYVSAYKVAEELAKLLSEGVLLLDRVIYPEYARMMSRGESSKIWKIVVKAAGILLAGGLALSAVVALAGPPIIHGVFGAEYTDAVGLSILLVLAAALMGVAAPLYPVFFAAGKPEQAIFARGIGLAVYVGLVFILSATIGRYGPGWAMLVANCISVVLAASLAKRILERHNA